MAVGRVLTSSVILLSLSLLSLYSVDSDSPKHFGNAMLSGRLSIIVYQGKVGIVHLYLKIQPPCLINSTNTLRQWGV